MLPKHDIARKFTLESHQGMQREEK